MIESVVLLLVLSLTDIKALPSLKRQTDIFDNDIAGISQYPSTVALLHTPDGKIYQQACVGTVLAIKTIITAGHCLQGDSIIKWRARIGSSWANSDGIIYELVTMLIHPNFKVRTLDSDVALVYTAVPIVYEGVVKPAYIAGIKYNVTGHREVWAVGFGARAAGASSSHVEKLRHIQIWTINQATCASQYSVVGSEVTSNMLCAGSLNSSSDTQCMSKAGGPLFQNGVLIGIYSWGFNCANALYPGIYSRISHFTTWIQSNAY